MQPFPLWIIWALAGHLANGAAFVLDKTLLRSTFKHPATYASLIGLLSGLAIILVPFGVHAPTANGLLWMSISGFGLVLALWVFFMALAAGETSRVVPIIGSLIPILTLAGTSVFLGERLSIDQAFGFALLVIATVILSGGSAKSRLTPKTIGIAIAAAVLFAVMSVTSKVAYDSDGFLTTFVISRLIGMLTAIFILAAASGARTEVLTSLGLAGTQTRRRTSTQPTAHRPPPTALAIVFLAQILGGFGYVGVQYATSLGSAALVNALQAIQYALLVAVAFALRKHAPKLLGEDLTSKTVVRKTVAIGFVAAGMWLIV
jgi:drug/metabolite transporter (DMT)-like permease